MAEALICLRGDREDIEDHILTILAGWKVKVYASMDDVFDRLWEDGDDVDLVVSEPPASFREELFDAAENWPDLLFVAVSEAAGHPSRMPGNLIVVRRRDVGSEILSRIHRGVEGGGVLRLDRRPAD